MEDKNINKKCLCCRGICDCEYGCFHNHEIENEEDFCLECEEGYCPAHGIAIFDNSNKLNKGKQNGS